MTQTIEQLTARVRELEEFKANVVKECASIIKHAHKDIVKQLAASQAYAEQLREALNTAAEKFHDYAELHSMKERTRDNIEKTERNLDLARMCDKALALPRDTSALDSYVSEKGKDARPDFRQMREMLRAMQAGELTVSRGIEILDMWHAGNWNDNMLPPVRQDLIEEDSMPVEIIDQCNQQIATLTRQRDLAVEALKSCGVNDGLKGPTQYFDEDLVERAIKESEQP